MDRITSRRPNGIAFLPIRPDYIGPPFEEPNKAAVVRLAEIEDILGDNYELEELAAALHCYRQLKRAQEELDQYDAEGRETAFTIIDGEIIEFLPVEWVVCKGEEGKLTGKYIEGPNAGSEFDMVFPLSKRSFFLSRKEAEEHLAKEESNE